MAKILGLDLGTNSLGWAITEQTDDQFTLIDKGVDIFQEGVAREKDAESPMVRVRTEARGLRRNYFRRRLRKIEILKVLVNNGLCPELSEAELNEWRYTKRYPMNSDFLLWQRTNGDKNPYYDRYRALTTTLDLNSRSDRFLLGRAIYHIGQHRGFLSNRKDSTNDEEAGKVKSAIKGLDEAMTQRGFTYLGEFYYNLYTKGEKIRTDSGFGYTSRKEHYIKEFDAICVKQNLDENIRTTLYKAIFFQRPLKSQKGMVGTCTFEKGKRKCPISHPRFEEFRMLSFVNNIKIKTPLDATLRPLIVDERDAIIGLFYRKSKQHFDFEDIAKKLSGKSKNYSYIRDQVEKEYQFNYRMSTDVSGSPVTSGLIALFGDDWASTICSLYTKAENKSEEEIINDIWHALFSFDDDDKLREWAMVNLQLDEDRAKEFVKIPIKQGYASLSLNAINKILVYLRLGYRYDEAVFVANLKSVVSPQIWADEDRRTDIVSDICSILDDYAADPTNNKLTNEQCVANMLYDNYRVDFNLSAKLYHPSKVEIYKDAQPNKEGVILLGSPRISSIRNPMAMRSLFRLRALVNDLLKSGKIDRDTKINIEFSRSLNDANIRKAIGDYQNEINKSRQNSIAEITNIYKVETGRDITPSDDEILKYQLWNEQKHKCLYTGEQISITDFIGANPAYDIEHTVPRSRGGDNSQMNKTLCQCYYNRSVKRNKIPFELNDHSQIMARIEELGWRESIEKLDNMINAKVRASRCAATKEAKDRAVSDRHFLQMKRDYLAGKLQRFEMEEVTSGFTNRQGVDIGIIGKYAKMYLETVFNRVYTVKGATTSDFRKMWGLQDEYTKKERTNHCHHCIDAITIACIGAGTYAKWAKYVDQHERHLWDRCAEPIVEKPWNTFVEDVKVISDELLVSHYTADNMHKPTRRKLRVRGKVQYKDGRPIYVQGDTARGSLHNQTFYGAIKRDDEIKYVVRKPLVLLKTTDVDKIVDDAVRECVKKAVEREGFKEATSKPICFNEKKGVYIKKVRIFTPSVTDPIKLKKHRDESRFDYKRDYNVTNESNYCMAIYEGTDAKGKTQRSFEIVNNLEAARYFNGRLDRDHLVPLSDSNDYPLKWIIKSGTMVLFYEQSPEELYDCTPAELSKRLYKVAAMSSLALQKKYSYGTMVLRYHQEASPASEIKVKNGEWKVGETIRPAIKLYHTQLKAYVEGSDFELTVTGEIKFKH